MSDLATIFNTALGRVGQGRMVADPDERSTEAATCRRFYDMARDSTLRAANWGFARRGDAAVQILNVAVPGFSYAYAMPGQCLAVRDVMPVLASPMGSSWAQAMWPNGVMDVPFDWVNRLARAYEVVGVTDDQGQDRRVIATHAEIATIVYTRQVTDPTQFDAIFVDALAWRLAYDLATTVARSTNIRDECWKAFNTVIDQAMAADGRETQPVGYVSDLILVRR